MTLTPSSVRLKRIKNIDLFEWQEPAALALALSRPLGAVDWQFNADQRFKKHQEAWVASRFAVGYAAIFGVSAKIRMVPDNQGTPDAIVQVGHKKILVDVTIVLEPGRKFREEYKDIGKKGPRGFHPIHWVSQQEAETWIRGSLENKQLTAYPGLWLVVYLNVFGGQYPGMKPALTQAATPWEEVCIIDSRGWKGQYACLFLRNGSYYDWVEFELQHEGR